MPKVKEFCLIIRRSSTNFLNLAIKLNPRVRQSDIPASNHSAPYTMPYALGPMPITRNTQYAI
ncbi:MAG: hypothetical protein KJO34_09120, partial [Deltaproteobacteria bacterium]|nr:hypothetical protein [Deltaproteobacteria bacterium]